MPFIGNTPDVNFTSFAKQTITGNGGTSYTLSHAVANENEVEIFVNNVRQEGGSGKAYTVSGTALTMTGNVANTDSFYVIFLGKALQTTVPPDGSVVLTSKVTGVLPVANGGTGQSTMTAWSCYLNSQQTAQNFTTARPLPFDTEEFDIGNNLSVNTTNGGVFTAPVNGIYQFNVMAIFNSTTTAAYMSLMMYVNNAQVNSSSDLSYRYLEDPQGGEYHTATLSSIIQLTSSQTLTPYIRSNTDTSVNIRVGARFNGFLVG